MARCDSPGGVLAGATAGLGGPSPSAVTGRTKYCRLPCLRCLGIDEIGALAHRLGRQPSSRARRARLAIDVERHVGRVRLQQTPTHVDEPSACRMATRPRSSFSASWPQTMPLHSMSVAATHKTRRMVAPPYAKPERNRFVQRPHPNGPPPAVESTGSGRRRQETACDHPNRNTRDTRQSRAPFFGPAMIESSQRKAENTCEDFRKFGSNLRLWRET